MTPAPKKETTEVPLSKVKDFEAWVKRNKITDLDAPDSYYDYRGAFMSAINRSPNGHFPDTFKQHGHPTFSVESQYSTGPGDGGHWEGEAFIPMSTQDSLTLRDRLKKLSKQKAAK